MMGIRYFGRSDEVTIIGSKLKKLSEELNIPILIISQISQAPEKRENHRPILNDMSGSEAIIQIADIVMFLYRDDYYDEYTEKKYISEVIIAKQRDGRTGTIEVLYLKDYLKYANLVTDR